LRLTPAHLVAMVWERRSPTTISVGPPMRIPSDLGLQTGSIIFRLTTTSATSAGAIN
jgi:hypothetical protein